MKRLWILLLLNFVQLFQLTAEEMYFQVLEETYLYNDYYFDYMKDSLPIVQPGEKVQLSHYSSPCANGYTKGGKNEIALVRIVFNKNNFDIITNDIAPWGTEAIFNPSLLTGMGFITSEEKTYTPAYYADVRKHIFLHCKGGSSEYSKLPRLYSNIGKRRHAFYVIAFRYAPDAFHNVVFRKNVLA